MTWNYKTSNLATYVARIKNKLYGFLKKEDDGYILLQDGGRIIVDSSDYQNKSSNITSWTYK